MALEYLRINLFSIFVLRVTYIYIGHFYLILRIIFVYRLLFK